jgi:SAM-dependent methyltransferase
MADLMHKAEIQAMVRDAYRAVTMPTGAGAVYYTAAQLAQVPDGARAWSLGVGNPMAHARIDAGDVVLDVGCGGGIDAMLAARRVGPDGRVIGLDLLPEMCQRAREHARDAGIGNAAFVVAEMEAVPLPDDSVDQVISNGVINLSARKMRALFECARVLRRGGDICLTDVTIDETRLPPEVLLHPAAWSGCAAGALAERVLLRSLHRVGLSEIQVQERHPLGVEDCARFPLFTAELLAVMRATIPARDQDEIGTCVTLTARKGRQDDAKTDFIASNIAGNQTTAPAVLDGMDEHLPTFDAGDRHCGDGVGCDLRSWWDAVPPGTRTVVAVRDPSTKTDVPSLARLLGHTVEQQSEVDGTLRVTIRVKGP